MTVPDRRGGYISVSDLLRFGKPGEAIAYRWHNGNGTFMAGVPPLRLSGQSGWPWSAFPSRCHFAARGVVIGVSAQRAR
jgi:hypothetical protein